MTACLSARFASLPERIFLSYSILEMQIVVMKPLIESKCIDTGKLEDDSGTSRLVKLCPPKVSRSRSQTFLKSKMIR